MTGLKRNITDKAVEGPRQKSCGLVARSLNTALLERFEDDDLPGYCTVYCSCQVVCHRRCLPMYVLVHIAVYTFHMWTAWLHCRLLCEQTFLLSLN